MSAAPMKESVTLSLLDDDPSVLRATGRLISSAGWNVETFSDPQAFLTHAQANRPPVAVLDVCMPLMHGLEVQTRLRDVSPSTRVIFLSSADDPAVQENALRAGAAAF